MIRASKWRLKCPRNFRPPPWILPKIFMFYTVLMYTFVIPSSMQKHTTGSLTVTHTPQQQLQTKSIWARPHRLLMVIWLAQSLLSCAKFRPLRVIKNIILLTLDWTVGMPAGFVPAKACFKLSSWFGKRHKTDAFTKLGNPLSEPQCLPGIVLPIPGHLSRGFTVSATKRAYSALHPQALTECSPPSVRSWKVSHLSHGQNQQSINRKFLNRSPGISKFLGKLSTFISWNCCERLF